jgi:putative transposase
MRRGFLYLVAIMDWATRKVLAWRLSNTMDVGFCVMALEEALARFGRPDIFNTDSEYASASRSCAVLRWGTAFTVVGTTRRFGAA